MSIKKQSSSKDISNIMEKAKNSDEEDMKYISTQLDNEDVASSTGSDTEVIIKKNVNEVPSPIKNRKRKREGDNESECPPSKKRKKNDESNTNPKKKKETARAKLKSQILAVYNFYNQTHKTNLKDLSFDTIVNCYKLSTKGKGDPDCLASDITSLLKSISKKKTDAIAYRTTMENKLDDNGKEMLTEDGKNKKVRVRHKNMDPIQTDYRLGKTNDLSREAAEIWIQTQCFDDSEKKYKFNLLNFRSLPLHIQEAVATCVTKYGIDPEVVNKEMSIPSEFSRLNDINTSLNQKYGLSLSFNYQKPRGI